MNRILVVGDVVDDVLVRPLGATVNASDTDAQIEQRLGGSAANVAAWLASAGATVTFVGRAGTDGVRRHTDALSAAGVDARIVRDPNRSTASIVVLIGPTGERTMYVDRGANASLSADDVDAAAWHDVAWLHLTGYSFFCPSSRSAALKLLGRARARGVQVSVDPSSAGFLQRSAGGFLDWVSGVDLLLPNLDEARVLSGDEDPRAAAESLLAYVSEVVVTCGADGAMRAGRDGEWLHQSAQTVPVVDTTGAGDAFCAGLLAARAQGRGLQAQLRTGGDLASRCVVRLGARPA